MKVDIFDFELDRGLIADRPAEPRDSCRLLDMSEEGKICDRFFYELPDLLEEGDVLVLNDTKVIPARLYGARGEALVEVTLYRPEDGLTWHSFIKNAKRLHPGDVISFYTGSITPETSDFHAEVTRKTAKKAWLSAFPARTTNSATNWNNTVPCPCRPTLNAKSPPAACGINITTKKIIRRFMPARRRRCRPDGRFALYAEGF